MQDTTLKYVFINVGLTKTICIYSASKSLELLASLLSNPRKHDHKKLETREVRYRWNVDSTWARERREGYLECKLWGHEREARTVVDILNIYVYMRMKLKKKGKIAIYTNRPRANLPRPDKFLTFFNLKYPFFSFFFYLSIIPFAARIWNELAEPHTAATKQSPRSTRAHKLPRTYLYTRNVIYFASVWACTCLCVCVVQSSSGDCKRARSVLYA